MGSSSDIDLLASLHAAGLPISQEDHSVLRASGQIVGSTIGKVIDIPGAALDGRGHLWLTEEQAAPIRVREYNPQPNAESYYARIPQAWKDKWKDRIITKDDWCPMEPDKLTRQRDFRAFISSSNPRFDRIIPYEPFWLYCEQALRWIAEGVFIQDLPMEEQRAFALEEFRRGRENPMYWAIKYGYIRDDEYPGGWRKYDASTPQALLFWARDCRLSGELGKGRQAAITSTMMLRRAIMMLTRHSHKAVLITDDVETTGQGIMGEKLLSSTQYMIRMNPWMAPTSMHNWTPKRAVVTWGSIKKSEKKTFSSETILASAQGGQTMNGVNVSEGDFDESQNIKTYSDIKREARPQMRANIDGMLRIRRQIWSWGTGNRAHTGGGAWENELKNTTNKWNSGEDTSTFIPLFFDWTCRPGATEQDYLEDRAFYLSGKAEGTSGLSPEEQLASFLSAWPSKLEDMFLSSHTTIIPSIVISEAQDLIVAHYHSKNLPVKGQFVPVYNTSIPMPEGSLLPFAVATTTFQPLPPDTMDCPIKMVAPPERGWLHRYYHGTDPIQSAQGTSAFASAIWDNVGFIKEEKDHNSYYPYVPCILNWRPQNADDAFIQSILMGMHYRNEGQKACKEVVEVNAGQDYIRVKTTPPFSLAESLWHRTLLPVAYRGGNHMYGVDMKNNANNSRKSSLFLDISRFHADYRAGNGRGLPPVPFYEYWTQMRDISVEQTKRGAIEFGVQNHKTQRDDLVFAVQYAKMSCEAANKAPEKIGTVTKMRTVTKTRMDPVTLQHYTVTVQEPVRLPVHQ